MKKIILTSIVLFTAAMVASTPVRAQIQIRQASFTSYYNPPFNGSDALSLSGSLPAGDYCNRDVYIYIRLKDLDTGHLAYAGKYWAEPTGGPPKCRFLSSQPGIKDLIFETIGSSYVHMTLLLNNPRFNWPQYIKNMLPNPPAIKGHNFVLWMEMVIDGFGFDGDASGKVSDYNERKIQLGFGD